MKSKTVPVCKDKESRLCTGKTSRTGNFKRKCKECKYFIGNYRRYI